MYKVFPVPTEKGPGFELFWCPSAPHTYLDKVPVDGKLYKHRQAAYRRLKQLREGTTHDSKVAMNK